MGIRFSCHLCNNPLHVKDYQAGKRGKCPKCQGSFRVPPADADFSLAIDESFSATPSTPAIKKTAPTPVTNKPVATKPTTPKSPEAAPTPSSTLPKDPSPSEPQAAELPASLLPYIDSRWYVRPPSGGQYGPATTHTLLDWIKQRRVTADSLVWREGLENWGIVRELIPEPFGGLPPTNGPTAHLPPTENNSTNSNSDPKSPPSVTNASIPPTSVPLPTATTSKVAATSKKKKQMRQQLWILGLLSVIAIGLIVALVMVLMRGA